MPKFGEIGLGKVESSELLRNLNNQVREMEKNAEQYLALQALRRPRRRRGAVVHGARTLPYSLSRSGNGGAWIKPLVKEVAILSLYLPVGDQLDPAHQPVPYIGETFRGIAGLRRELDLPTACPTKAALR